MAEPFFLTSISWGLTESEIQNVPSGEMLKILPVSGGEINSCIIASQKGRQGNGLSQTERERERAAGCACCVCQRRSGAGAGDQEGRAAIRQVT